MDQDEWEVIGYFSRYRIMASGEKRKLLDPETGKIIREYTVPVYRDPAELEESQEDANPPSDYVFQTEDESQ